jgi:hypothetical protein
MVLTPLMFDIRGLDPGDRIRRTRVRALGTRVRRPTPPPRGW